MANIIHIYVDGACRRNGSPDAIGAYSAIAIDGHDQVQGTWSKAMNGNAQPITNQRAELFGLELGLKVANEIHRERDYNPRHTFVIKSDSEYAVKCATEWICEWQENDWKNYRGQQIANKSLVQRVYYRYLDLCQQGQLDIQFMWISRARNGLADELCNDKLDQLQREMRQS